MQGVHSIMFDTLADAVEYAKQHGGWIAKSGVVQWFDASRWTQTPIIEATSHLGTREIGTWRMFDPQAVAEYEAFLESVR